MLKPTITKSYLKRILLSLAVVFAIMASVVPSNAQWCNPSFGYGNMNGYYFAIVDPGGNYIYQLNACNNTGYYDQSQTPSLKPNTVYHFYWYGGYYYYCYYYGYPQYVVIYCDANNNYSFTDAGETIYTSPSYYYSLYDAFQLPPNGTSGIRRFRVVNQWYPYGYPTSCGNPNGYGYGSYFDLNINAQYLAQNDAGISNILSPSNYFRSENAQTVTVQLKNYSKGQHLVSCTINWSVNGVTQPGSYSWTGDLDTGGTASVTLGTTTYTPASPWNPLVISAWTTNPKGKDAQANLLADGNSANDTKTQSILPIYNDAGFVDANSMIPINPGINNVKLKIKNYTPKPLATFSVNWTVSGLPQPSYNYNGPAIPAFSSSIITVGQYNFSSSNQQVAIWAQTQNPNGISDEYPANDTGTTMVYVALPGGTYTVGATGSDYTDMCSALAFIDYWGVAGPVTYLVRPGTYNCQLTIKSPSVLQYPITVRSMTGSPDDVIFSYSATGAADNWVIKLDGYNSVTLQDITFSALGSSYARCLELVNGNQNLVVNDVKFNGKANAAKNEDGALIHSVGNTVSNLQIMNSQFTNGSVAIMQTTTLPTYSSGATISGNTISSPTWGGIRVDNVRSTVIQNNTIYGTAFDFGILATNSSTVTGNRISGVKGPTLGTSAIATSDAGIALIHTDPTADAAIVQNNTVAGINAHGIFLSACAESTVTGNSINISSLSTIDRAGITSLNSGTSSIEMITNNTINGVNLHGIYLGTGTNAKVYYNKVIVNTGNKWALDVDASGGWIANNSFSGTNCGGGMFNNPVNAQVYYNTFYASSTTLPAIQVNNAVAGSIFKRNIFYNATTGPSEIKTGSLPFAYKSDENAHYSNTASTFSGTVNGTNYTTIAAWRTATGLGANSVNEQAFFMSAPTDLRLTQLDRVLYSFNGLAELSVPPYNTEIELTDLWGNQRTNFYYMGAFEVLPTITVVTQPNDVIGCYGEAGRMFIVVSSISYGGTLTYQWQKDGVDIPGATGPILYLANLTHEMPGVYRCNIRGNGEASPVTTQNALLYTVRKTEITRQPETMRADIGGSSTAELDMHIYQEDPPEYQPNIQWYRGAVALKDNDRIAGSKSSIISIRNIQPADYGTDYRVVISGLCGSDSSKYFAITEVPKINITPLTATNAVCEGGQLTINVTATLNVTDLLLSYQWRKDGVNLVESGRIHGTQSLVLTVDNFSSADAGSYDVMVSINNTPISANSNPQVVTMMAKPAITNQPAATLNFSTGKPIMLDVISTGEPPLSYQWYKDNNPLANETNATLTIASAATTDAGTYKCTITNQCGNVSTQDIVVSVTFYNILGVDDGASAGGFILMPNIPNPFSKTTSIGYVVPSEAPVKISLTDVYGREIAVLLDQTLSPGTYQLDFNADEHNLAAGVYTYVLTSQGYTAKRNMVIVK